MTHQELIAKANAYLKENQYKRGNSTYPHYHLVAPCGWINDPNGFCYALGKYHMFYQHYPYESVWGPMHWGHAISNDLINWKHVDLALAPSEEYDKDGCFSGSAIEHDGYLYLMYTGHVWLDGFGNDNAILERQCLARSQDGIHFEKLGVVIDPPQNFMNFRDPKVWRDGDKFYAVVGGEDKTTHQGHILKYQSSDLMHWEFVNSLVVADDTCKTFMFECPDFFPVNDGKYVVATSPMGLKPQGITQNNPSINQWQYGTYDGKTFTRESILDEIDNGHDFYASQSMQTPDGRRVIVGWMNMWKLPFASVKDNWCGAITLPREVIYKDNHLYQRVVSEVESLVSEHNELGNITLEKDCHTLLGACSANRIKFDINLKDFNCEMAGLAIGNSIRLYVDRQNECISLFRLEKNATSVRSVKLFDKERLNFDVYIDNSSIEVFINDGYKSMTTCFFRADNRELYLYATNGKCVFENVVLDNLKSPALTSFLK